MMAQLTEALELHRAGDIQRAEPIYRAVLAEQPDNADALNLLGQLVMRNGRNEEALALLRRAVALVPNSPGYRHMLGLAQLRNGDGAARDNLLEALRLAPDAPNVLFDLGNAEANGGMLEAAAATYRRLLTLQPEQLHAIGNLAVVLEKLGRRDEQVALLRDAASRFTDNAELQFAMGSALLRLDLLTDAEAALARAAALRPEALEARFQLATAWMMLKRNDDAIALFRELLALAPSHADGWSNLGVTLRREKRYDEARDAYQTAMRLNPKHAGASLNLGNVFLDLDEPEQALEWFRRSAEIDPDRGELQAGFARSLRALGKWQEAIGYFDRAIELAPNDADIQFARSLLLLLLGRDLEGLPGQETRVDTREAAGRLARLSPPRWDGRPIPGGTLLLHAEQGFGDTFQFVRYVAAARARVGRVVLAVQPGLQHVLRGLEGVDLLITNGDTFPDVDAYALLLSLPLLLGGWDGAAIPYLHAEAERAVAWARRIGQPANGAPRIGFVWAGSSKHRNDRHRSIAPTLLMPLLEAMPKARFFSLQVPTPAGLDPRIRDLSGDLRDFADTAAALQSMDLLISVDTAVAHLAGALGRPVWLLLPFDPDWRWRLGTDSSAFYPEFKLFRQQQRHDWPNVIAGMAAELPGAFHFHH